LLPLAAAAAAAQHTTSRRCGNSLLQNDRTKERKKWARAQQNGTFKDVEFSPFLWLLLLR
jgi:hypothetical protein